MSFSSRAGCSVYVQRISPHGVPGAAPVQLWVLPLRLSSVDLAFDGLSWVAAGVVQGNVYNSFGGYTVYFPWTALASRALVPLSEPIDLSVYGNGGENIAAAAAGDRNLITWGGRPLLVDRGRGIVDTLADVGSLPRAIWTGEGFVVSSTDRVRMYGPGGNLMSTETFPALPIYPDPARERSGDAGRRHRVPGTARPAAVHHRDRAWPGRSPVRRGAAPCSNAARAARLQSDRTEANMKRLLVASSLLVVLMLTAGAKPNTTPAETALQPFEITVAVAPFADSPIQLLPQQERKGFRCSATIADVATGAHLAHVETIVQPGKRGTEIVSENGLTVMFGAEIDDSREAATTEVVLKRGERIVLRQRSTTRFASRR